VKIDTLAQSHPGMEPTSRSLVSCAKIHLEIAAAGGLMPERKFDAEGGQGDSVGSTDKRTGQAVTDAKTAKPTSRKPAAGRDVGDALRAVYHDAVDESIPREMLDLLNKLS
jgi:hypothetical protein